MKKIEKIFKLTADILDKKLKNGTVMVVIISVLITLSGFLTSTVNANITADIMQSNKKTEINQFIIIDGKKYKIILEEVK